MLTHCFNQGENGQDIVNYYQDPGNRRAEWGSCAADRRQIFNLSGVAESPKFDNKTMQKLLGNWQLSPIFTRSTGAPLTVTDGTDISLTGLGGDRPNVAGNAVLSDPTVTKWFDAAAFARQAAGTFGNAGRGVLRGPGAYNFDMALSRSFPVRESIKLNLRWEMFNTLNHVRYNNPGVNLNSGTTFGIISSALDPRIMQVAAKLVF